jgi:hypothetical protein
MHPLGQKHKHVTIMRVKIRQKHTKHLPKSNVAEIFGWFASFMILSAYALLSFGILTANSPIYHGIFLVGSTGLAVVTYRHRAFQSLTVNVFFGILAIIAIIRTIYFV